MLTGLKGGFVWNIQNHIYISHTLLLNQCIFPLLMMQKTTCIPFDDCVLTCLFVILWTEALSSLETLETSLTVITYAIN
jgi:hypothetical protein